MIGINTKLIFEEHHLKIPIEVAFFFCVLPKGEFGSRSKPIKGAV